MAGSRQVRGTDARHFLPELCMSSTSSTVANVPRISATRCFLQATFKYQLGCLRELGQPRKSHSCSLGSSKATYLCHSCGCAEACGVTKSLFDYLATLKFPYSLVLIVQFGHPAHKRAWGTPAPLKVRASAMETQVARKRRLRIQQLHIRHQVREHDSLVFYGSTLFYLFNTIVP